MSIQPGSEEQRGAIPPSEPLYYPEPRGARPVGIIPDILCCLLILLGILALAVIGPRQAPPFDALTEFSCDPLPVFSSRHNDTGMAATVYTCRSGRDVVYQRGAPPVTINSRAWQACRRHEERIKIWRHANPSPYGAFVFQTSCNGEIYADYQTQAANYKRSKEAGFLASWLMLVAGIAVLGVRITRSFKRLRLLLDH
jgi:hypothetical protein